MSTTKTNAASIRTAVARIAAKRHALGLSQVDAAKRAGLRQSNWSAIESGKAEPRWDTLRAMARAVRFRATISLEDMD